MESASRKLEDLEEDRKQIGFNSDTKFSELAEKFKEYLVGWYKYISINKSHPNFSKPKNFYRNFIQL